MILRNDEVCVYKFSFDDIRHYNVELSIKQGEYGEIQTSAFSESSYQNST